jgi:hypothetical protein
VLERSLWCHAGLFAFGMALAVLRVDAEDGLVRACLRSAVPALGLLANLLTAK